jgi:hypothetical protein
MPRLLVLFSALLLVGACDSNTSAPETTAVYVGNQGIFSDNSGTLTRHDPASGATTQDAVPNLGGLVQALRIHDGRLYVLLNFADSFSASRGRIDVVDLQTGQRVQQIDVSVPRSMDVVGGTAFVSNFYTESLTAITLATGQIRGQVAVGANPEGVAAVGDRVYVSTYSASAAFTDFGAGRDVRVVSATTLQPIATIDVGCDGPRALLADGDGEVWVFCTGKTVYDADFTVVERTNGEAVVLNGASGAVVARIPLDAQLGASSLGADAAYSAAREEAWAVVGGAVVRFDTRANARAGTVPIGGAPIGAVAYDDTSDQLYLGRLDPTSGFSADGFVSVHDRAGAELRRFPAGVIPGAIAFQTADQ